MPGVENEENQEQVSPVFHPPVEIAVRDFHIPTAPTPALQKWESRNRIPTFPTHGSLLKIQYRKETSETGALRLLQAHYSIRKCFST